MSTATLTSSDVHLRDAVVKQLDWDPEVDASAIGVAAKDGVVTLTGYVDNYLAKIAAERVTKRVRGVRAVANDVSVRVRLARTDPDIARDAADALRLRSGLANHVQAAVHNGHVTLTGRVGWLFQKRQAEDAVRPIEGVVDVFNHIHVQQTISIRDIQRRIVRALHHRADVDAHRIEVSVQGTKAVLTGTVSSWTEREAAEQAVGSAPGIACVENKLTVAPAELAHEVESLDEEC